MSFLAKRRLHSTPAQPQCIMVPLAPVRGGHSEGSVTGRLISVVKSQVSRERKIASLPSFLPDLTCRPLSLTTLTHISRTVPAYTGHQHMPLLNQSVIY
ncbi:hypothetical protein BaRGS_00038731 [Batillaria attramentaria]|uniref:Uncharacterized protein n=1 Tax=Batillaria attramentaria TaxID=370345 RepID=A0ABD0J509_9CAEN